MASVIPPDLELFLTGWLRSNITDVAGLQVEGALAAEKVA